MIRKISGKTKSPSYTHLNTPRETKATSKEDIANTFEETFLKNSSSRNYLEKFKNVKKIKKKINFKSLNNEEYNNYFNLLELKDAIQKSHDTVTGPDEIHYQMLKHLPENALLTLLHIFKLISRILAYFQTAGVLLQYYQFQNQKRSCRTNKL